MYINDIKDCYKVFSTIKTKFFGVGVTAFMRIIPAFFLKENFEIICYKDSLDLDILGNYTNIFSLQKVVWNKKIVPLNTSHILQQQETLNYCKHSPWSHLLVYKNTIAIEKTAKEIWYTVADNKPDIRDFFENKKHFRKTLECVGISPIFWENITYTAFLKKWYIHFQKKYGKRLVFQLPEIKNWWWLGTFFVNDQQSFDEFIKKIQGWIHRNTKIFSINITQFIDWISCSIIWCATKHWTFSSSIQTQLLDISDVIHLKKWSWLFCWHDRSYKHFSPTIQQKASSLLQTLWAHMYHHWYKWIFWVDLIIDEKQGLIYVVECNPRYTWAFPMISLLDIKQWIIPMDVFHILEHMDIPYTINFEHLDKAYKYIKEGSHIILCNKKEHEVLCKKNLLPGVYTYIQDTLHYIRPWIWYADIKKKNEFIIIDGNPRKWDILPAYNELSRFCHLLFPKKISLAPNRLNNHTKKIIACIYATFITQK